MVNTKNHVYKERPLKLISSFDNGNAVKSMMTIPMIVAITVRLSDTIKELMKFEFPNVFTYASVVNPMGQKVTRLDDAGAILLNETANI